MFLVKTQQKKLRIKIYFSKEFLVKTRNYTCILSLFPAHALRTMPRRSCHTQLSHKLYWHDAAGSTKFDFFETLIVKTQNYT